MIFSSSHRVGPRTSESWHPLHVNSKRAKSFGHQAHPLIRSYYTAPFCGPKLCASETPRKPWFLGVFNIGKGWIPRCKLWTAFQVCYTWCCYSWRSLLSEILWETNKSPHTQKEFVLFTCKIIKSYSAFISEGVKALYFLVLQCTSSALTKLGRIWQDCNVQLPAAGW